ncbi:MAG: hypothetical protein C4531_05860 [Desulfurivibrio sp.]|jgi:hypothetical protein|nr:MAG: hypothetical protein C4531_05860 [Desulfurivibrio sp.]
MKKKGSLDFYLLLATVAVLFVISIICIYGMFYFKLAQLQQLDPAAKLAYMNRMNSVMAPFVIALILLLGVCVPKRLLPVVWLNRFALVLTLAAGGVCLWFGVRAGLALVLAASLLLQLIVLALAAGGSELLHFEKSGYWVRLGSSLIHLGIILFVLDLFFYQYQSLHLLLFWITTGSVVLGMIFCFYAQSVVQFIRSIRGG